MCVLFLVLALRFQPAKRTRDKHKRQYFLRLPHFLHSIVIAVVILVVGLCPQCAVLFCLTKTQMSNDEIDYAAAVAQAIAEVEKAPFRSNRRPSVQFIDKNVIRRRSSGNEKQQLQPPRLPSISSKPENNEPTYFEQQNRSCEIFITQCRHLFLARERKKRYNLVVYL